MINHEPVLARRPSAWRHCVSFARRHKPLSFAALAILAGLFIAAWQAHRANEGLQTLKDVLFAFCTAPDSPPIEDEKCVELVDRIRQLDLGGSLQEASVYANIGNLMKDRRYRPSVVAEELLKRAIVIRERTLGPVHHDTLRAHMDLSYTLLYARGNAVGAEQEARTVLRNAPNDGRDDHLIVDAQLALAKSLHVQGRYAESLPVLAEATAPNVPGRAVGFHLLGYALSRLGRHEESVAYLRTVDRMLRESRMFDNLFAMNLVMLSSHALLCGGDLVEAERLLKEGERCMPRQNDFYGFEGMNALKVKLAGVHWARGEFAQCERILCEMLSTSVERSPWLGQSITECRNMLGVCLRDQGRWSEAEPILRGVLDERTRGGGGPQNSDVASSQVNLAKLLVRTGRGDEALELSERALEMRRKAHGPDAAETIEAVGLHGEVLVAVGRTEEGLELIRLAMQARENGLRGNWIADLAVESYANALVHLGCADEAESLLSDELDRARSSFGPDHLGTIRSRMWLNRFRADKEDRRLVNSSGISQQR